ncbi:MAG: hypothetical protein JWQ40_4309 [Segetibacter sp.]|nr:hypothetical protein [Segetibacter sp.]
MNEVGVGTRVLNFLVDTILIFILSFIFYKWWTFYVKFWNYKYFPFYMFFHATIFVYYTIFETIFNRTPGKWLSLSKVRNAAGGRAAWYQVVVRSLIRVTLIYPFFIPILGRPLHDALSKTRVVEA